MNPIVGYISRDQPMVELMEVSDSNPNNFANRHLSADLVSYQGPSVVPKSMEMFYSLPDEQVVSLRKCDIGQIVAMHMQQNVQAEPSIPEKLGQLFELFQEAKNNPRSGITMAQVDRVLDACKQEFRVFSERHKANRNRRIADAYSN